jgi:hypothetical protein
MHFNINWMGALNDSDTTFKQKPGKITVSYLFKWKDRTMTIKWN